MVLPTHEPPHPATVHAWIIEATTAKEKKKQKEKEGNKRIIGYLYNFYFYLYLPPSILNGKTAKNGEIWLKSASFYIK